MTDRELLETILHKINNMEEDIKDLKSKHNVVFKQVAELTEFQTETKAFQSEVRGFQAEFNDFKAETNSKLDTLTCFI